MTFKIGFIVTVAAFGAISCADLPKGTETRFWGEPYINNEYEGLDDATRQETEYKADSITKRYNNKFAENCTPYSEGQNQNPKRNKYKRLDCVTFK